MNNEQIESAERKVKQLIKFSRDNDVMREFIERLTGGQYLNISTAHQFDLGLSPKETYELIGEELVELLKKKLWERQDHLEKLTADDLVNP